MNGERRLALCALIAFAATIPCVSLPAADHLVSSWTLVPAYRWTCGCAPTAAAMAMGYRDHYALLQDGVTPAKETRYGKLIGSYMDREYLESITGSDSLPYLWGYAWAGPTRPELILDLARAMNTKGDGGTSVLNIRTGINAVAQSRGYGTGWSTRIIGSTSGPGANDWAWSSGVAEINAHRPFVWSASSSPVEGHSVCVWGYTDDKYYVLYNTWDEVRRDWYYAYYLGETAYPVTMVQLDTVEPRNGNTGQDVRLIAPDGGESLRGDVPVTVRWQQYGTAITQVDILLSTDGGKNWSVIGSSIPSASGERTWQWIPSNTLSTVRARLKIEGWQSRLALHGVDGSKLNFSITPSVYHAVTFDVSPRYPGVSLVVDGTTYTAPGGLPVTFQWLEGTTHTFHAPPLFTDGTAGVRYQFLSWSDTGSSALTRTEIATSSRSITAFCSTRYRLVTAGTPSGAGSVSPAGETWQPAGSVITITASPQAGWTFTGWSGSVDGSSNPAALAMSSSRTAIASFADLTPPAAPMQLAVSPSGWSPDPVFSLQWNDPPDPTGIAGAFIRLGDPPAYSTDGQFTSSRPVVITASAQGGQTVYVWLRDGAGNTSHLNRSSATLRYDTGVPISSVTPLPQYAAVSSFTVRWSGFDTGGSGIVAYRIQYATTPGAWTDWLPSTTAVSALFGNGSPVVLRDGVTYSFRSAATDGAGNAEPLHAVADAAITIDVSGPSAPAITCVTHSTGVWSSNASPVFQWTRPPDTSGVAYYVCALTTAVVYPLSVARDRVTTLEFSSYSTVADHVWYFHVRAVDAVGNAGAPAVFGPILVDASTPTLTVFTVSRDPAPAGPLYVTAVGSERFFSVVCLVQPHGTSSGTPVHMYSVDGLVWSGTYTVTGGNDGPATVHFSAADQVGTTLDEQLPFVIDTTPPSPPVLTSLTHREGFPSVNMSPVFVWEEAADLVSGVAGYSCAFNTVALYVPPASTTTTGLRYEPGATAPGVYYLHVRAVDRAGNASPVSRFRVNLVAVFPEQKFTRVRVHPNPWSSRSEREVRIVDIPIDVMRRAQVDIYALTGEHVRTLTDQEGISIGATSREAVWNGTNKYGSGVASGMYFIVVRLGDTVFDRVKLVIIH